MDFREIPHCVCGVQLPLSWECPEPSFPSPLSIFWEQRACLSAVSSLWMDFSREEQQAPVPWANSFLPLHKETLDLRREWGDNIEADKETRQQIRLMDCLWMSGIGFNDSRKDLFSPEDWKRQEKMREMGGESGKTNRKRFQAFQGAIPAKMLHGDFGLCWLCFHTLPAGWEWLHPPPG